MKCSLDRKHCFRRALIQATRDRKKVMNIIFLRVSVESLPFNFIFISRIFISFFSSTRIIIQLVNKFILYFKTLFYLCHRNLYFIILIILYFLYFNNIIDKISIIYVQKKHKINVIALKKSTSFGRINFAIYAFDRAKENLNL